MWSLSDSHGCLAHTLIRQLGKMAADSDGPSRERFRAFRECRGTCRELVSKQLFQIFKIFKLRHGARVYYDLVQLKCQKRHETRVSAEKKYRKKFARSTACRRYLTRLSRKKDGALLALLRRSRLTSGCPWGAGTVSFVVFGRNREFFVA